MKTMKTVAAAVILVSAAAGLFLFGGFEFAAKPAGETALSEALTEEHQEYTCGMHPFIITKEPGNCPICQMALTPVKSTIAAGVQGERKIKYWVAAGDPSFIRDQPGKSPQGEDLVPVYEDESVIGQLINIDPVTRQNMGVRSEKVVTRDLSRTIRTVGVVGYEEPKQYSVNSKIEGWIEKLLVNETGGFVKKGQPLLEIYSPQLVAAQEEFLLALRNRASLSGSGVSVISAGAARLVDSSRKRLKYWDISDRQIAELERKQEATKTLVLHAPYDGIVTLKNVSEGVFVKAGMELFRLADISKVWVYADIYEYELPWVKVGQAVRVQLPYRGREFAGRISTIYPYVDQKTRTVKARIDLDNPDFELKPDMYVNVRISSESVRNVLSIPIEAVLNSGEQKTVFVERGHGKFEPRLVKTGLQDENGYLEVVQGLLADEMVVTSAQFMLDSESTLRTAIQKMLEPKKSGFSGQSEKDKVDDLFTDDKKNDEIESLFN
ncbi:MAG: efflux RND transporter periplasmic adaptor subunit [Proteobacteria bacterium]|nr:efflux RND transporter periplasmic adaptor subunit [Pseudomonadota bacterium]MBU1737835.1 efflux RND transporter periplasmic adaptor subunit [Pseudomonadota bacterium]